MSSPTSLAMLKHVHHGAYRCRDAEQTRWFYEDVLGLPLTLAMEFDEEPGTGRKVDYMHLFFQMGDDNFIAFFDAPDSADEMQFRPRHAFDLHLAFEVDTMEQLKEWRRRINKAGRPCFGPVDHDFIHSIYFVDPNGIPLEITVRDPSYDKVVEADAAKAHDALKAWTEKTRAQKEVLFGAALDMRGIDTSKTDFSKVKAAMEQQQQKQQEQQQQEEHKDA
ncbi:VOC family protein [Alcanivorax sp.]|uniref:VOC family protein n=1 Tax=Alcanivorax sp. TaxID=1872427 RepID=UPI0025BFBA2C|nr:VOC family protein [Alcanivorax sp.]